MTTSKLTPAAAAKRDEFVRVVEFENETRLHAARDALRGLRDLCLECRGDFTKIGEVGYILGFISQELDAIQIGVQVEMVP